MKLPRYFLTLVTLLIGVNITAAKDLNLETNPEFVTVNSKRYVIVAKDGTVTFKATTDESVYYLSWIFENGSPGTGSTDDPPAVTYGDSALGKENEVKFTTKRYDEDDNHCVTTDKRTCAVVVPKFITPAQDGDPEGSPKDSGDGQNEFTFDTASPGVLTINLKAALPGGIASDVASDFTFEVESVGSSTLTWDANNPGGQATASGDNIVATVTFEGLPDKNSAFGEKEAKLKYKGDVVATAPYEVFFDATATNHPGGNTDPNWFYYYKDAVGGGSFSYANTATSTSSAGGGESSIKLGNTAYSGEKYITTTTSGGQLSATGWSSKVEYFAYFVGVLAHERHHANEETTAGPPTDADQDFLSNDYETNTSNTDPNDKYSARGALSGGAFDDGEVYAGGPIEENAINSADTSLDWANPGTNSK